MSEVKPKKLVRCISCGSAVDRKNFKSFYKLCLICFDAAQNIAKVEYIRDPQKFNQRLEELKALT